MRKASGQPKTGYSEPPLSHGLYATGHRLEFLITTLSGADVRESL
jgi:hypothetical protein